MGGELASVHTSATNRFLLDLATEGPRFWIGGYEDPPTKTWKWSDGSGFNYSDWIQGEPSNTGFTMSQKNGSLEVHIHPPEDYLEIVKNGFPGKTGTWNDLYVFDKKRFMCQLKPYNLAKGIQHPTDR